MSAESTHGARDGLESHRQAIAIFLLLALADETLAAAASERAAGHLKSVFVDPKLAEGRDGRVRLIEACKRRFEAERAAVATSPSRPAAGTGGGFGSDPAPSVGHWKIPAGPAWTAWQKFARDAGDEERVALALSRALKFPDDEIADGLGISVGTLRHRLSRGARALGAAAAKAGVA